MSYDFIYLPFVIHPQDMVGRSGKGWRGGGGGGEGVERLRCSGECSDLPADK